MKKSMAYNIPRGGRPGRNRIVAGLADHRGRGQTGVMNALLEAYILPMMGVVLIAMLIWAGYDSRKN